MSGHSHVEPMAYLSLPSTYVSAATIMIVVALITAWFPGWRAITLQVSELLRTS